jgi:ADP-ribosylation factor protein 1
MGGFWSFLLEKIFATERIKVLFRGLDGAGKTTIMYQIKGDGLVSSVPTVGWNRESITLNKNITIEGWDLGGGWMLRQLDHHHYDDKVKAMVWVVDCSDL